ncbi:MAG: oligopeptide transporter, OPT family [Deltaproteobacteria bacterium]|nr:oligopeptide transporter, OPT family [Deltaproteobacteria bacterium]
MEQRKEFTVLAVVLGAVLGIIMTAANVYLGLYAGMTVSASIPAAVVAAGILHGLLKQKGVLQANIVQTMASAGESLAAGIIFTVPALVIVGAWTDFAFWPTTFIAIAGGLLGVIFMIPLRKALIVENKELSYPEGVACAVVLKSSEGGNSAGLSTILKGLTLGAVVKFLVTGLHWLVGSVEAAFVASNRVFFVGLDVSPALLAVGYIVKLRIATTIFLGGVVGWLIAIPLMALSDELAAMPALDAAWTLWSTKIRYLGVGAMLVGGIASIVSVRKGLAGGLQNLGTSYRNRNRAAAIPFTETDISLLSMGIILTVCFAIMFGLYVYLIDHWGLSLLTTLVMIALAFPFVAVSSYIVGLVGSSNNPVSGITIAALLVTAALFLALGYKGDTAIMITLGVAAIVCCSAATAADLSQDLKTGALVGASPRYQQMAQSIGVIIPAFVIAPVLTLLHSAYGIGQGLKAPQATLFASLAHGLFVSNSLPYNMIGMGAILAGVVLVVDAFLKRRGSSLRLHVMPLAIGIYLPFSLTTPIFLGGLLHHLVSKRQKESAETDRGVLMASGLIAGEAIMGVILACFIAGGVNLALPLWDHGTAELISLGVVSLTLVYLYRLARRR